jgi:hypothetical protein
MRTPHPARPHQTSLPAEAPGLLPVGPVDTPAPQTPDRHPDSGAGGRPLPTPDPPHGDGYQPRRYVTVAGPVGVKRVVRADSLPLGTPHAVAGVPSVAPSPASPTLTWFAGRIRASTRRRRYARHRAASGPAFDRGLTPSREQLLRWRQEAGIGQRELAARCGLSRSTVAEVEAGRRTSPASRRRLAAGLGHGDPCEWAAAAAAAAEPHGPSATACPAEEQR